MAIQRLRVDLLLNSESFNKGLKTAEGRLKAFGSKMTSVGKSLSTRITLPLALAGGAAVKSAAEFQKLQTQLKVLTGSADAGSKAFERLVKFSAKTPFQLNELVRANNTLMGFGLSADEAFDSLGNLGDIAAVSGGDLQRIAVAFGQSAAAGRVMAQDINQLINNGIPVIELLSKSMGVATSEVKQLASEGAVTFPVLAKAFKEATAEGGKFENGMAILSETFLGQFSTLKDNLNIALAEFGRIIIPTLNSLMSFLTKGLKKLNTFDNGTKKLIVTVGAISAALPPLVYGIGLVATAFGKVTAAVRILTMAMAKNPLTALATAVVTLTIAFNEALHKINPLVSRTRTFFNIIKSGGNPLKFFELQALANADALKEQEKNQKSLNEENKKIKNILNIDTSPNQPKSKTRQTVSPVSTLQPSGLGDFAGIGGMQRFRNLSQEERVDHAEKRGIDVGPINIDPQILEPLNVVKEGTTVIMEDVSNIVHDGFINIIEGVASGNLGLTGVFGSMVSMLGDVAIRIGKAAVAIGKGMMSIKLAFKNPFTAVAAGLALIAIGAAIKNFGGSFMGGNRAGNIPSFAKGGIVSAPTLALVGDNTGAGRGNPEVIAPLNKLQGMIDAKSSQQINVGGQFRVEGQDLVLALQRADRERNRIN